MLFQKEKKKPLHHEDTPVWRRMTTESLVYLRMITIEMMWEFFFT